MRTVYRLTAFLLVLVGLAMIVTVVFPIVSYELFTAPRFATEKERLLSPIVQLPAQRGRAVDLTRASNWFTGASSSSREPISENVRYYTISIPKLNVEKATVEIAGEDLSQSLIHYQGTALPGRIGNAVIFGHSVLPQFFNPKNYLTIFSTLPTLQLEDELVVDYDGITYKFAVSEMFEVEPNDIQVLDQVGDKPSLTLITCTPPGTYLKRLVVRAELILPDAI